MDREAEELGRRLTGKKAFLAVAESCTGGLIAKRITDIAGSSGWFERGLVVYSNASKQDLLGISPDLLARFGAVSRECAEAMARGLLVMTPAHWAVAITGIAGPGGGSTEKPVGTVHIALATPAQTRHKRHLNPYDRETFKIVAARQALDLLRREFAGST